ERRSRASRPGPDGCREGSVRNASHGKLHSSGIAAGVLRVGQSQLAVDPPSWGNLDGSRLRREAHRASPFAIVQTQAGKIQACDWLASVIGYADEFDLFRLPR